MAALPPSSLPPVEAVAAFDDYVAQIVRRARAQGLAVPPHLFDWAVGEGTELVERLARRGLLRADPGVHAVADWAGPWIATLFPHLRPVLALPESLQGAGGRADGARRGPFNRPR